MNKSPLWAARLSPRRPSETHVALASELCQGRPGHLPTHRHPPALGINFLALHGCSWPLRETSRQRRQTGHLEEGALRTIFTTTAELMCAGGIRDRASRHLLCLWIPKDARKQEKAFPIMGLVSSM